MRDLTLYLINPRFLESYLTPKEGVLSNSMEMGRLQLSASLLRMWREAGPVIKASFSQELLGQRAL